MVLQRDQVTVWERHIKNTMLTRLDVSALIWGDFGLAQAADDLVHTFAGRRPKSVSLEELLGHGTLSRHPKGRQSTPQRFRWAQFGLVAKGGNAAYFFLWSNVKYHARNPSRFVFSLSSDAKLGPVRRGTWSAPDNRLISLHTTVNFGSFYDSFSAFAHISLCVMFLNSKICQLRLFKHATVDGRW